MTLHRLSSSSRLLASKGAATPLGLRKAAVGEAEDEAASGTQESHAATEQPTQLTLVADLEDGQAAASASEPPPPASLLPFALHRKRPERSETWELVSPDLLERLSQSAGGDRTEETTAEKEPEPEPRGVSAAPQEPGEPEEVSPPRLASPGSEPVSDPLEASGSAGTATEASSAPSPEAVQDVQDAQATTGDMSAVPPAAPVADPAWRVGIDTRAIASDSGLANWLGLAAAAILLVGGIAWWSLTTQTPAPAVESGNTGPEAAEPAAIQGEPSPKRASSGESAVEIPAQTPTPAARTSSAPATPGKAPGVSQTPKEAPSAAVDTDPLVPSVDLVRIEPNGDAVIAGRAAPNSELILLDNGKPIGSVKADAFGEWVFVPDRPLPQGAHEFGLVLKAVQGKVRVPAEAKKTPKTEGSGGAPTGVPPSEATPAPGDGAKVPEGDNSLLAPLPSRKPGGAQHEDAVVAPIPARKPDIAAATSAQPSSLASPPSADFVVQLASVKTRDGARREWRKLQSRFPEALSGMALNLHETKLSRQGTVIRVRTGPFPGFSEAVDFCAQIRTGRQDCLVVRTSGGN